MALRLALALIIFFSLPLPTIQAGGHPSLTHTPQSSPGARVWYMQGNELWAMNLDGSNAIQIGSNLRRHPFGCNSYYVSPNGQDVAFQLNDGQLVVANADGGNLRHIAAGRIGSLSWSPDSQHVIYALNDDIYLYNLSQGSAEGVATGGGRFAFPTFAPDGQNVAFLEAAGDNVFHVIVVPISNREWRSLGTTASASLSPESLCSSIVNWSPDSTRLLIDYGQPVFVFYLAGGTPTQVGGRGDSVSHFWSPSGNLLAFKEHDSSLWLVNPDGSGQRPLVAEPVGGVAWNPTGRPLIAYTTTHDGSGDLCIINIETGQKQQLTSGDASRELSPAWTPDSGAIIFERQGLQGEEQGIWRVSLDGSGLTQLTSTGSAIQLQ